ncbi:hypothetical protein [Lentzea sp. E54]|uniref:hypothetical protein n=1 Tax=Lentzea xerophila TaxID=3435883 RepID=UPI003DA6CD72
MVAGLVQGLAGEHVRHPRLFPHKVRDEITHLSLGARCGFVPLVLVNLMHQRAERPE